MKDLEELLEAIYIVIRKRNTERGPFAVPQSDEFFDKITKDYSLIPYSIPNLIKILVDSHKIFSFVIVEADHKERVRRVDGFVVTEGNIIKLLLEFFSDELVRVYSHEFSTKYSVERIIKEFIPKLKEYNNTPLGNTANIVINLMSLQSLLERNIMIYGAKWQEKQIKLEIEKSDPLSGFIDMKAGEMENHEAGATVIQENNSRRAVDSGKYEDFRKYQSKNSLDKTLTVYGIEFYTRVCFRDYQFSLVFKIIDDDFLKDPDDLMTVKKMLQKIRANSDQDLNLQKFAKDINDLEKLINQKLKQGGQ
jgi:hypothetical protein